MHKRKDYKISQETLEKILADEWLFFKDKILNNCYCSNCDSHYHSTIVSYGIFVNYLNDIIFKGFCKECGKPIARYTETGEDEKKVERIKKLVKFRKGRV